MRRILGCFLLLTVWVGGCGGACHKCEAADRLPQSTFIDVADESPQMAFVLEDADDPAPTPEVLPVKPANVKTTKSVTICTKTGCMVGTLTPCPTFPDWQIFTVNNVQKGVFKDGYYYAARGTEWEQPIFHGTGTCTCTNCPAGGGCTSGQCGVTGCGQGFGGGCQSCQSCQSGNCSGGNCSSGGCSGGGCGSGGCGSAPRHPVLHAIFHPFQAIRARRGG